MTTVLRRVLAITAAGGLLAGCESLSSFQMPSFGLGGPATTVLNLETDPPGAEAKLSAGGSCRTPCALPAPLVGEMTVSFVLPGYQPTTIPVRAVQSPSTAENGFAASTVSLDPNPIYVELQAVRPPPPARRRPTAQRARTSQPSAARPPRPSAPAEAPAPAAAPPPATIAPATPLPPQ